MNDMPINITPLIDIVFLLLIFFMLTTTLDKNLRIQINLPKGSGNSIESSPFYIEVGVTQTGDYSVNGKLFLDNNEKALIQELINESDGDMASPLVLYADGQASHQAVVTLISIIEDAGFKNLQLAIQVNEELERQ